eukprot:Platyproteum_vivax@DN5105_c1_g1_i2.p2
MLDPENAQLKELVKQKGGEDMLKEQIKLTMKSYYLIATLQSEEKRTELYKEMDQIIEKKENKKIKKNEEIKKQAHDDWEMLKKKRQNIMKNEEIKKQAHDDWEMLKKKRQNIMKNEEIKK